MTVIQTPAIRNAGYHRDRSLVLYCFLVYVNGIAASIESSISLLADVTIYYSLLIVHFISIRF